jgi:branched-chain amino acid transport system permease protein
MENFIQLLVQGILVGMSYAVLAAGLTLIFGVMNIINFAHAAFAVLAMYFPTFWFLEWWGVDPFVSAIIALPIFFVLGYLAQRLLLIRVIFGGFASETSTLIMTMGFSLLIENLILIGWSGAPRIINQSYTTATWRFGEVLINQAQTYSMFGSIVLIVALFVIINKTIIGKSIKAASDDPQGCAYMGISLSKVYGVAFGLAIAITAAGGCLMATYRPFNPFYAESIIVLLFASVVLGGMGSIPGAVIGALIIGIVQQLSSLVVAVSLQNVAVFLIFVGFLYLRPQGILGKKGRVI